MAVNVLSVINENLDFQTKNNIISFINDESKLPEWSKRLNDYFVGNNIDLKMQTKYKQNKQRLKNPSYKRFFDFISESSGVMVDLASGPSGYFSPLLDRLCDDNALILTDACPAVIHAHSNACMNPNFYVFEADLDKELPFKNESISAFSGNLLNNVDNYPSLIKEVCRCLKPNGRFALIEMFFEHGCETFDYLNKKGAIWSSFETFVDYCTKNGLSYVDSEIIAKTKGKLSERDMFPLNDNDVSSMRIVYFTK